jgi:uncharacterized membrane protein
VNPIRLSDHLWWLYAAVAGVSVLVLCFLMPPFQVNDEFQHFFRSYQISEGIIVGQTQGHTAGGDLPASLPALVMDFLGSLNLFMVHPVVAEPVARTFGFLSVPLNPGKTVFVDFSFTAFYAPTGYLPQTLGIFLARSAGSGPLGCLFAGRVADGMAAVVVTGCALRVAPFGRYALFTVGLLPTVLSLDASVSQDASVVASLLMFTALCLRAYDRKHWSLGGGAVAASMGIIFAASKLAYAPLLLLALAPCFVADKPHRLRAAQRMSALVIAPGILCTLLWLAVSHKLAVWHENGNYIGKQIAFILGHPVYFSLVLTVDIISEGLFYLRSSTSMMVGWPPEIALPLPSFLLIIATLAALAPASAYQDQPLGRPYRCLILWLIPICGLAVLTLIYLAYEPVGWPAIDQAQGRHFIPLTILLALFLATAGTKPARREVASAARCLIVAVPLLNAGVLIAVICERYHLALM